VTDIIPNKKVTLRLEDQADEEIKMWDTEWVSPFPRTQIKKGRNYLSCVRERRCRFLVLHLC